MLSKLRRLFNQYCDHHFTIPLGGFPIFDGSGAKIGHIDRICLGRNSVRIEGWSTAEKVSLGRLGRPNWLRPDLARADVQSALKLKSNKKTGFNIASHGEMEELVFSLKNDATSVQIMLPLAHPWSKLKANLWIKASFWKRVLTNLPTLARTYVWPNIANKAKAKAALGMVDNDAPMTLDARVFNRSKDMPFGEKLTLIMPIYNAFEILSDALTRIEENTDLPWRVILCEDCSTDPRIRPLVRKWCDRQAVLGHEVILLENEENEGFIGSVNRAFSEALKFNSHVVLLNSDALLPKNWACRLIYPILKNPMIASVTPFSNDAEIANVPFICNRSDLACGEGDVIDGFLRNNLSNDVYAYAPTGVGFCMALNRAFLKKLSLFDKSFGQGYGEEVDWCCKIQKLGGKHVIQPSVYVEHRGAASFGSLAKQSAIERSNQVISRRHPRFDDAVQQFINFDPLASARIFAAIARLTARQTAVEIYIAHSLGGGAELYLKNKISEANSVDQGTVVLRVGGRFRWRLEVHDPDGMLCGETDDETLIKSYFAALPNAHILYSCAVGDHDPSGLPKIITTWIQETAGKFTFLVHDYFAISPSYCLLDSNDVYYGALLGSNLDEAHTFCGKSGRKLKSAEWRRKWFGVLQHADTIECFSKSSARILQTAFPALDTQIKIKPHPAPKILPVHRIAPHTHPTLGVLGDIGLQKGASCLQALSQAQLGENFQSIVVVGKVDPSFALGPGLKETGRYDVSEITGLAEHHQIVAWLIPSIWPETYSYTMHEALATGLPVFCFDLGGQAEAAQNAENGNVLPLDWEKKPNLILTEINKVLDNAPNSRSFRTPLERIGRRSTAARAKSAS